MPDLISSFLLKRWILCLSIGRSKRSPTRLTKWYVELVFFKNDMLKFVIVILYIKEIDKKNHSQCDPFAWRGLTSSYILEQREGHDDRGDQSLYCQFINMKKFVITIVESWVNDEND